MDRYYVSGNWVANQGREEEFIQRWTEFTDWSAQHAPGARSFVLIRDERDTRHFLSVGTWDDPTAIEAWRGSAEFAARLRACVALCEQFTASDYTLAAHHARTPAGIG